MYICILYIQCFPFTIYANKYRTLATMNKSKFTHTHTHTHTHPRLNCFSACHTTRTCVLRSSVCVDMCVWVGLEMTSIIYCVGSQLGSCSIINGTVEILTLRYPVGEEHEFKPFA